jgi:glycosyltransferase involved in cell wall biosynthesis
MNGASTRPLILHIASDFSDDLEGGGDAVGIARRRRRPTLAVNNLVEGATDFDHIVFSLRRRSRPIGFYLRDIGTPRNSGVRVFIYVYFGLPLGLGMFASQCLIARTILRILRDEKLGLSAVHAHRLTFDGIGGWLIARALKIPLFISVRGEVDDKVLRYKPVYRLLARRIVKDADWIFYVSAWFAPILERYIRFRPPYTSLLPNIVSKMQVPKEPLCGSGFFLTVVNLDIWNKKGLAALLPAFAAARLIQPTLQLKIVGGGTPRSVSAVNHLIEELGIKEATYLEGKLPNAELRRQMSKSIALVLPSQNETFGMVYLEALFAKVPIIYSKGTGIDGFLDGLNVGVAVDPKSVPDITRGLIDIAQHSAKYRSQVIGCADELVRRFGTENVIRRYQEIVRGSL